MTPPRPPLPKPPLPKPPRPPVPQAVAARVIDAALPHNKEAEEGVIGSCILDPNIIDDVIGIVKPSDFYHHVNKVIFETILDLHNANRGLDIVLLMERIRQDGYSELVSYGYVAGLVTNTPHAAHAKDYAATVADKSLLRQAINAATSVVREATQFRASGEKVLSQWELAAYAVREQRASSMESVKKIGNVLVNVMAELDKRKRGEQERCITTGMVDLDKMVRIKSGMLVILAARPSMGKSALASNIVYAEAKRGPVLFINLEMSDLEIGDRMLAAAAQVPMSRMTDGSVSGDEARKLLETASMMNDMPMMIDDTPSRTVTQIAAIARKAKRTMGGLNLIVVDYLQLIEPENQKDPRQEQVAKLARRLKVLARELKVPIIALAQLNRQADTKDNRPKLSHLRESGAIEQDADVVMFVHRPEYYADSPEEAEELRGKAEIVIAKQRNGAVGIVPCVWQKEYQRFVDAARHVVSENADSGFNEWNNRD